MLRDIQRQLELGSITERQAAVKALAAMGGEEAVKLLLYAQRDDSRYVRRDAEDAIRKLGYGERIPPIPPIPPPTIPSFKGPPIVGGGDESWGVDKETAWID